MNAADWLTAVLTPLTFAFVVMAELRYRRMRAGVTPFLAYQSSDEDLHSYALMNLGSDSAVLFSTEATTGRVTYGDTYSVLRPGEDKIVTVWSDSPGGDWVLFNWIDPADVRFVDFQWFPLAPGALADEWSRQLDANNVRYKRTVLLPASFRRRTRPVGPGAGVLRTSVRRGRSATVDDMRTAKRLLSVTVTNREIP